MGQKLAFYFPRKKLAIKSSMIHAWAASYYENFLTEILKMD